MKSDASNNTRWWFSVRSLLFATFLVAWVLAVNNALANPYGWLTSIPLAYSAPLLLMNPRTILGGGIGALMFGVIGELGIGWPHYELRYWLAIIVFVAYGFACGAAVHAIFLKRYVVGTTIFFASATTLIYNVMYPVNAG